MQNSKLINLLKALNPEEFRQFYRYLRSPFFTQSKELLQLYDYIRKQYPHFETLKLNKEIIFRHLYPKESFNGPRLRNLMLKITKIVESYFLHLELQKDQGQRNKLLTHIYGKRNLNVIFKQKTEATLKGLESQPNRDADYFFDSHILHRNLYFHPNTGHSKDKLSFLNTSLHQLNQFYGIERLKLGIELTNRERIFDELHDFKPTDYCEIKPEENVLHALLLKVYFLLKTSKISFYEEAKKQFITHLSELNQPDAQLVSTALLNFAIQQFPTNEEKYSQEAFDLYQVGLDNAIFIQDGYLRKEVFVNIVVIGSKLKAYDWVNNFIKEYQQQLSPDTQTDIVTLARCFLLFHQADYEAIPDELQSYRFKDSLYKINAKTILIRAYYKLFEENSTYGDMVVSNCTAFERFIKRECTLNQQKKEPYLNFAFLIKKMVQHKLNRLKMREPDFSYMLDNFSSVFAKSWLQEAIQT